jgi:hypothetical protein
MKPRKIPIPPGVVDNLEEIVVAHNRFLQKYQEAFHEYQIRVNNILSTKYEHSESVNNEAKKVKKT